MVLKNKSNKKVVKNSVKNSVKNITRSPKKKIVKKSVIKLKQKSVPKKFTLSIDFLHDNGTKNLKILKYLIKRGTEFGSLHSRYYKVTDVTIKSKNKNDYKININIISIDSSYSVATLKSDKILSELRKILASVKKKGSEFTEDEISKMKINKCE